ncbi:MAG: hypothetical protein ACKVP5_18275, partial [Aestuariivirga sp.]
MTAASLNLEQNAPNAKRVLYIGTSPVESEAMLKSSGSEHQFKVANGVADALALVTRVAFDAVIVDQGD